MPLLMPFLMCQFVSVKYLRMKKVRKQTTKSPGNMDKPRTRSPVLLDPHTKEKRKNSSRAFAKFTKPLKEQKDLYFCEKGVAVTLT